MKKFLIICILIQTIILNAEPPRKPFVVLRVNGKEYQAGATIDVRPGERISITAVLLGGRRDYCSNPQKYANIGQNTVIQSQGENGMSFYIGDGTFRGTWSLVSEIASFTSSSETKIIEQSTSQNIKNTAIVEVPKSGYGQVYVKVKVTTKWHYERYTQAGRSDQEETNDGEATFYFKIAAEEGVWYSSANLTAKGIENFSVRNSLDNVQQRYDDIYNKILKRDFTNMQMFIDNLKTSISSLKSTIDNEKSKDANFKCELTFIGLPTTLSMQHLQKLELLSNKWKEQFLIAQENVAKINEILPKIQSTFSANVLKSVFKNYINWGTSIPTGATDFLTLYDPSGVLTVTALPGKVLDWYSEASEDASILNDQVKSIKMLSELRKFYLDRMTKSNEERKKIVDLLTEIKPVKQLDADLRSYFSTISWATIKI